MVCAPDKLLQREAGLPVASALETMLAWSTVLQAVALDDFRAVFPVDPPERNLAWAVRLGRQLAQLQSALAESGWEFGTVAGKVAADPEFPEIRRWEQLAELEARYRAGLAREGRQDAQAAKLAAAAEPELPAGIERILVLATPDPLPLALTALAQLAARVPVTVAVFAPEALAGAFDAWGRPRPEAWQSRPPPPLSDFSDRVRLELNPEAQAERIAEMALAYRERSGALAIGVADPALTPPLLAALRRSDLPAYDPQGHPRREEGFYHLLAALADFQRRTDFAAVEAVGRCPDILTWLADTAGFSFSTAGWLAALDDLRNRALPADLLSARRHALEGARSAPELIVGLSALAELQQELAKRPFAAGVTTVLARIFARRRAQTDRPSDLGLAESAAAWMKVVRECDEAGGGDRLEPRARPPSPRLRGAGSPRFTLATADWWDLALRLFGDQLRAEDKPAGAFELHGWIELLWEDAPHLVVAGMNDGLVPAAIAGDSFLPESLREKLGLKTNLARLARDAYLLAALAESRRAAGRVDLLVGKSSADGEPLRPSRLLLLGSDATLAERVQQLFRAPAPAAPPPPWTRAWCLVPPAPQALRRVSVTALRSWLDCPFRFYLRHGLKMEAVDAAKGEMDQLDFGTLCHAALEAMGRDAAMAACTEPEPLRAFLLAALDREARRRFGDELSLPLLVQLESARQRLSWLAQVQAAESAQGWRIEAVEKPVVLTLAGLELAAKIDRIDRHRETGAVRVLDYKTSDTAVNPAAAHLKRAAQMRPLPAWAHVEHEGKPCVWADLQLPMYRHALAAEYPTLTACGYFNLPKASADTRLDWWEPYPLELQESAVACATGVCEAIGARQFWPPHEKEDPERDPFAALFQHGVAASIDPSRWLSHHGR
jgi:ATP-dependent helicase/nuclease subunit B